MRINRHQEHREHLFDFRKAKRRNSLLIVVISFLVIVLMLNQAGKERRELVVSRVEETARHLIELGSAMERYETDTGRPVLSRPGIHSAEELWPLTTPHAYLWNWEEMVDPFVREPYRVGVLDSSPPLLFLLGTGPNGERNLNRLPPIPQGANHQTLQNLMDSFAYDPTNGLISEGDLFHPVGQWTDFFPAIRYE